MSKAPKSSSFGLAGGVLSVLGLCVGIVSLGKKQGTAVKSLPAPFAAPRQEAGQPVFDANDRTGAQVAELFVEQDLEPQLCSEESAIGECLELGPERSAAQDTIADLAKKGDSTLAIAQALGISIGEVQLTLRLQYLSAAAGRKH